MSQGQLYESITRYPEPSPTPSIKSAKDSLSPSIPSSLTHTPIPLTRDAKSSSRSSASRHARSSKKKDSSIKKNVARTLFGSAKKTPEELYMRGYLGEEKFYNFLKKKVKEQQWKAEDTDTGFTAFANGRTVLTVQWLNKNNEESYQPLDFIVIYKNVSYVFEVKSTKYPKTQFKQVHLSGNEWEKMRQHKSQYALVLISAVESENSTFDIKWNPFRKIIRDSMRPDNMILKWGHNTEEELFILPKHAEIQDFFGEEEPQIPPECRIQ